jgi:tRNA 2-thiocytidine biosynthesis protein TtcA
MIPPLDPTLPRQPARRLAEADETRARRFPVPRSSPAGQVLRRLMKRAGRLIQTWDLIRPGDRVLCAVSGGKDSYALLDVLIRLRAHAPIRFDLAAIVVQPGYPTFDHETVAGYCGAQGVETYVVEAGIWQTLLALDWVNASPCALCSRLRRGTLYRVAREMGWNTLALGHHADDSIETALLNMCFAGQLRAMPPLAVAEGYGVRVIRPLLTAFEHECRELATLRGYPLTATDCSLGEYGGGSQRHQIKRLITDLSRRHPKLRNNLLASLGNVAPESLLDQRWLERIQATGRGAAVPGGGDGEASRKSDREPSVDDPDTT